MTYRRWRDGLLPGYAPTFADLTWYANEGDDGDAIEQLKELLATLGVTRLTINR